MVERPTILALDLGQNTGWALLDSHGQITSGTMTFKPGRFEGGGMSYLRFRQWLTELLTMVGDARQPGIDAIYFEEVRRHIGTSAAHAYEGFLANLTAWCECEEVPYSGVPVGTIKKFITGNGGASKKEVIAAVQKLGHAPADDNEADALALLYQALTENRWLPTSSTVIVK